MATRNKKTGEYADIEHLRDKRKKARTAEEAEKYQKQIEMLEDNVFIYRTNVAYKVPLTVPKAAPIQVVKTSVIPKTRKLKASWKVPSFNVYIDDDEE